MIDGRAFEGLVWMAMVGIGAVVVLFLTVPPVLLVGIAWLAEPRTGIAWQDVAWWGGGAWVAFWIVAAAVTFIRELRR